MPKRKRKRKQTHRDGCDTVAEGSSTGADRPSSSTTAATEAPPQAETPRTAAATSRPADDASGPGSDQGDPSPPPSASASASASPATFQEKVDNLLVLIDAESRGGSRSTQIDAALSTLVPRNGTTAAGKKVAHAAERSDIVADEVNYDSDDDDDANDATAAKDAPPAQKSSPSASAPNSDGCPIRWTGEEATLEDLRRQDAELDAKASDAKGYFETSSTWKELADIPLGKAGAQMMVTFGDGPNPKPAAVAEALMGTRRCLQHAVKDARALRRKMRHEYRKARVATTMHQPSRAARLMMPEVVGGEVDPNMLFRAISGYDQLAYDTKCGFDVAQLETLFPEEMKAYQRWESGYETVSKDYNEDEDGEKMPATEGDADGIDDSANSQRAGQEDCAGGHLQARLAQFDARTAKMKDKWYLEFAEVRQGSFLSRKGRKSLDERQWDKERKRLKGERGRGRRQGRFETRWENLAASSVQFLHWLGFDQRSALPPPNEDTTQALAFLGYDFMGKIVEKAIFLRYLAEAETKTKRVHIRNDFLLELHRDEQLEANDIERALKDTTLNTKPLYSASNSVLEEAGHVAQLYFGPGFEERLEVELDNLVGGRSRKFRDAVTEEERKIRKEEDELFAKLAKPPVLLGGIANVLGSDMAAEGKTNEDGDESGGGDKEDGTTLKGSRCS